MRKIIFITFSIFVFSLALPTSSNATIQSPQQEEQMGKKLLDDLSNKTVTCSQLKDVDFEKIGEYFMGQMMGDSHEAMNKMMEQMMGKVGEEKMHVAMGKRMSNCEPNASLPQNMMSMMMGGGMMGNFGTNPMSWLGWGFSWILMILFWVVVVVSIIALIVWLIRQIRGEVKTKSALDILKERYGKGEIDKKEFEEKKKDLS